LPPPEYLDLLTTRASEMYGRGRVAEHQHTIATLWSLSLDRLRDTHPAAVQLLTLCAWLAPEPIPLELFTTHPDQLPAPLREVATDPLALADTVGALADYSLARRTNTGLLLHRLVQAVLRQPGPHQPDDPHLLPTVLALLRADLPEEIMTAPRNWPPWRGLLLHVLAATGHHDDTHLIAADDTSWLLDRAATYQRTHGEPATARPLFERALRIREITYGPEHPRVATALNHLAGALCGLGEPVTARPLLDRALHIRETTYGPDHPEVATILNNLALALRDLGDSAAARPLLERALHIYETTYGPDHPHVATTLNNLVLTLRELDKPTVA
ncbi:MAG: tetratricopeptide repeat protein, partial [Pseudonocardiaceae bacterium]